MVVPLIDAQRNVDKGLASLLSEVMLTELSSSKFIVIGYSEIAAMVVVVHQYQSPSTQHEMSPGKRAEFAAAHGDDDQVVCDAQKSAGAEQQRHLLRVNAVPALPDDQRAGQQRHGGGGAHRHQDRWDRFGNHPGHEVAPGMDQRAGDTQNRPGVERIGCGLDDQQHAREAACNRQPPGG